MRDVSRREPRRAVDKLADAPFSPLNLRVFQQTWHAIVTVLRPLLDERRATLLPRRMRGAAARPAGEDGGAPERIFIAEGCPSSTLRRLDLPRIGYKGRSEQNRRRREEILAGLREAGGVPVDDAAAELALADGEGDALDSLVLLAAAQRCSLEAPDAPQPGTDFPAAEGWIYV